MFLAHDLVFHFTPGNRYTTHRMLNRCSLIPPDTSYRDSMKFWSLKSASCQSLEVMSSQAFNFLWRYKSKSLQNINIKFYKGNNYFSPAQENVRKILETTFKELQIECKIKGEKRSCPLANFRRWLSDVIDFNGVTVHEFHSNMKRQKTGSNQRLFMQGDLSWRT